MVSNGNMIRDKKNRTKNHITKIWTQHSYYLTHSYFHGQTDYFIIIYIDNEVWRREQQLENNALPCVENHPYKSPSGAVYNNTMKKQYSYS